MRFPLLKLLAFLSIISMAFSLAFGIFLLESSFLGEAISFEGKVLGAVESGQSADNINKIANSLIKDIKEFSFSQLPRVSQAQGRLPENNEKQFEKIEPFNLRASCGSVTSLNNSEMIFKKEAGREWPVASITKLVTAMVFLGRNPGWETIYEVRRDDRQAGGKEYLFIGEKVRVRDLFYLSLVGSSNTATIALANSTGMSKEDFVGEMNKMVMALGLKNTHFYDSVGLSNDNISTAAEIAEFSQAAFSNEEISKATLTKKYEFTTLEGRKKAVYNTDDLLGVFPQNGVAILGGKTGYTEAAGYCLVGMFSDDKGRKIISVVLGGESKDSRFSETKELVKWSYENYFYD